MIETQAERSGAIRSQRSAYNRSEAHYDPLLAETARGTKGGEYLRRFWQVVAASDDATRTPVNVRVLSEDLILYRDGSGTVGLLYPRCAHRGTSLYYGATEEHGIRCCYHGWVFDADGSCLEQPLEPDGGRARNNFFQPFYPVEERYGLVFAYMGPLEKLPQLPRYACLEHLAPDEAIVIDKLSRPIGGPVIADYNWFQHYENIMDPFHVVMLHDRFSGSQFVEDTGVIPEVTFEYTARGIKATKVRILGNGHTLRRVTELALPTLSIIPDPTYTQTGPVTGMNFMMPIDDTHFRVYGARRLAGEPKRPKMARGSWEEMTPEEKRAHPGDYEAQSGQGTITLHSEDHLAATDRGVAMLRKRYRQQVELVASGGDPEGLGYNETDALIEFESGNFIDE
jgi:nitrite reductase/ring-hydroxylating ferredoxin subunit